MSDSTILSNPGLEWALPPPPKSPPAPAPSPAPSVVLKAERNPLDKFRAILLPPAITPLSNPKARFEDALRLAKKKMAAEDAASKEEVVKAAQELDINGKDALAEAKPTIEKWVDDTFSCLESKFLIISDSRGDDYVDKTLYIIITPEFAFNGRVDVPSNKYDAEFPFHQSIEEEIARQVKQRLQKHPNRRIVFALSCCTYSNTLLKDVYFDNNATDPDKMIVEPKGRETMRSLAVYNRMTVVTSTDMPPKVITKVAVAGLDAWNKGLNPGGKVEPNIIEHTFPGTIARLEEVKLDLAWFGEKPNNPDSKAIAFGTCLDVQHDKQHGNVNLAVYLGGGTPRYDIADKTHAFVLNDIASWKERVADMRAGYYTPEGGDFKFIPRVEPRADGTPGPAKWDLKSAIQRGYEYTDELPLPAKVDDRTKV